jgi:1-acyl-sn-glycerol-3-phosphate acyltransferase
VADRVYRNAARCVVGLTKILDLRVDIAGQQHAPPSGGAVIVMNHMGYLDFALGGLPFWLAERRPVRFMAKQEVFEHRLMGPLMRGMHHIPVDRKAGAGSFRTAVTALRAGELVGVFPEATISRSFCLKEFKSGAVRLARTANVPLIPVALWGNQRLWTKARKPGLRTIRHIPVSITVGEPMYPKGTAEPNAELVRVMDDLLQKSRQRYPVQGSDDPWWIPAHLGGTAPTPEEAAVLDTDEQRERAQRRGEV